MYLSFQRLRLREGPTTMEWLVGELIGRVPRSETSETSSRFGQTRAPLAEPSLSQFAPRADGETPAQMCARWEGVPKSVCAAADLKSTAGA